MDKSQNLVPFEVYKRNKSIVDTSIVGSVVEFSPATREARVRFPDNAFLYIGNCF